MNATLSVDGHVALLTLENSPLNIITAGMRPHLVAAITKVAADPEIRALVVTGAGERAFCAGADLNEEADLTPETVRRFLDDDCEIYDGLENLPIPVIAAINGHCMGGGLELALSCDIRVAADDALLRAAGVRVGLVVSTTRMTRLAGPAVAKDVILTGRTFTGAEAKSLGIVARSVPRADVLTTAMDTAREIAGRAPLAVRRAKQAIGEALDLPYAEAMERELQHFAELSATEDHKHAIAAFFARQTPQFKGR
ncbi:enoyl-CoA hydratase/isomerase family protein [Sinosporangium siamense]|uniref:Enoyl-CoA hydratase n=1 Tax=Sinosporangium siamense TaxID=1367973 RepID=A0A919V9C0_9ACTN|nr:enoyl-CoA hydratase/isomerase family protein [Sinosporangium siamense]GII95131.1 enoyl-CoA hydratase [Sinosporangium siamense]